MTGLIEGAREIWCCSAAPVTAAAGVSSHSSICFSAVSVNWRATQHYRHLPAATQRSGPHSYMSSEPHCAPVYSSSVDDLQQHPCSKQQAGAGVTSLDKMLVFDDGVRLGNQLNQIKPAKTSLNWERCIFISGIIHIKMYQ